MMENHFRTLLLVVSSMLPGVISAQAQKTWDFQHDTADTPPSSVVVSRDGIEGNTMRVIGKHSSKADPFDGSDNQSLYYGRPDTNAFRPGYADFQFPAQISGMVSFDFYIPSTGEKAGILEVQVRNRKADGRAQSLAVVQFLANSKGQAPALIRYFSGSTEGSTALDFDQRLPLEQKNSLSITWGDGHYSIMLNGQPLTRNHEDTFAYANPEMLEANQFRITATGPYEVSAFIDNVVVRESGSTSD
jgi:hypothetical protein